MSLTTSHTSYMKQAIYGDQPSTPPVTVSVSAPTDNTPRLFGLPLKYVSLITLAVQNATLTIIMHYSRVSTAPSKTYSAASAVLLNELLKGSISMFIALLRIDPDDRKSRSATTSVPLAPKPEYTILTKSKRAVVAVSPHSLVRRVTRLIARFRKLGKEVFSADCWKLSIPAILYVIQNNLQFVAASNLDVATFQVTYQMKILTTAGFSVILLRKRLTTVKWLSLLGLAVGVGIVQIQTGSGGHGSGSASATAHVMNPLKGFLAVASACMTSGLAGVYFEMVLKGSQADLWVRNVQLSLFSLLPALVPVVFSSNPASPASGGGWFPWHLFQNFGLWAWATVLIQVFGGLVTAVVIKYSDNIMKGFATSLSIIISFLASVALFDFSITLPFVIGASVVLAATWFYNQPAPEGSKDSADEKSSKRSSMRLSLSSLTGSRRSSAIPGSPVGDDSPIIGQLGQKKKSPLPTPRGIAAAIGRALSRPSSPTGTKDGASYFNANGNGAAMYRNDSSASLAGPPPRNPSNAGFEPGHFSHNSMSSNGSSYGDLHNHAPGTGQ
ncbi:hypothetical protein FRB99_001639 [Tulasnella sp. 403]|nr:hypothetical protein FRB99_001639 [Tulasnella sp. 403]